MSGINVNVVSVLNQVIGEVTAVRDALHTSSTQPTASNSDYAAALRVYGEFCNEMEGVFIRDFRGWCEVRLNAAKAPHSA